MDSRTLDLQLLADALRQLYPTLPPDGAVRLVGDGFSSYAVSVDDRWLFRIARNADAQASHAREVALLPLLRERLPLPIPEPHYHAGPSEAFPFGLMGYEMLEGTPWTLDMGERVDRARVARQLAEFLSALHAFPAETALAAGVEVQELHTLVDEVLPALPIHLDAESVRRFHAWWDGYRAQRERYAYTPRLLHNDLWCENILLADDALHAVGVVDFEQMCIGDPVAEFAALRYVGGDFIDQVRAGHTEAEELEPHFDEHLAAAVLLRELAGLRYALRYPETDELGDAVEKVARAIDEWLP